ncbi:MFS transporter [Paeniglutamicibacter sp. ABSL32-1]|uniref:MFS transporter n=1 Tax=Paeniglutamicibacter TaxID=1742990 RepID=UPI001C2D6562|nr:MULTISPECIES: MFS transporter [Paeniglutamicibacter]MBV1779285.1 MFS transporter [Paeniglutamicibacter quisquiliarum]MCV9994584.1 MFS transporter [Paeniglutamicibacter sp. ZC-3]
MSSETTRHPPLPPQAIEDAAGALAGVESAAGAPAAGPVPATRKRWVIGALTVAAVVLVGLNLRAAIASAAPLFHDLEQLLGYGTVVASLLPTIPVLCFAFAGAGTAWLVKHTGLERAIGLALLLLTLGLAVRAFESTWLLLAGTVLGMSGLAICNVAMPSFIREHHASRSAAMTATYTVTMSVGATTAAALSVPVAARLGSPTLGLAAWAIPAALALLVFLPLAIRGSRTVGPAGPHVSPWPMLATRRGLLFTSTFAVQSMLVYTLLSWLPHILISRGSDAATAGFMLGLVQAVSIPTVLLMLWMASKPRLLRAAFILTCGCAVAGFTSLLLLPVAFSVIPAILTGMGLGIFPLLMLMISRSGESAAETTALSTLAQSVGYLVAAAGPFGLGLLQGVLGSWTVPLAILVGITLVQFVLGYRLGGIGRKPNVPVEVRA